MRVYECCLCFWSIQFCRFELSTFFSDVLVFQRIQKWTEFCLTYSTSFYHARKTSVGLSSLQSLDTRFYLRCVMVEYRKKNSSDTSSLWCYFRLFSVFVSPCSIPAYFYQRHLESLRKFAERLCVDDKRVLKQKETGANSKGSKAAGTWKVLAFPFASPFICQSPPRPSERRAKQTSVSLSHTKKFNVTPGKRDPLEQQEKKQ